MNRYKNIYGVSILYPNGGERFIKVTSSKEKALSFKLKLEKKIFVKRRR